MAAAKRPYCQAPTAAAEPNKRHRTAAAAPPAPMDPTPEAEQEDQDQPQPLLPGLPDHLAQLCLSPLPPQLLHAVCRSWRHLLYSPSFPPFLSLYAVLDSTTTTTTSSTTTVSFAAYDAISGRWDDVPSPPTSSSSQSSAPSLWHPSFLSRRLPLQSVAAGGQLVLVAGSTASLTPALPRPVAFDPCTRSWRLGPRFPFAPRRWCAAGTARGRVFVAGGVGAGYDASDARSGATWDPAASSSTADWEAIPPMRDARFSRDAADAVCGNGKVCMVSVRGRGAKEGAVFDLRDARWEDMPPGMLAGWKGPGAGAAGGGGGGGGDDGDEEEEEEEAMMFVVDEERGALCKYDWAKDRWLTVLESEKLMGAAEMAVGGGKVCVAAHGGEKVFVVDVAPGRSTPSRRDHGASRPQVWEVAAPPGKRVVALHVLPRMARAE